MRINGSFEYKIIEVNMSVIGGKLLRQQNFMSSHPQLLFSSKMPTFKFNVEKQFLSQLYIYAYSYMKLIHFKIITETNTFQI